MSKKYFSVILLLILFSAGSYFYFSLAGIEQNTSALLQAPSWNYIFGTDSLGRNFFWRVQVALFNSIFIAFSVSFISLALCLFFNFFLLSSSAKLNQGIQKLSDYLDIFPNFVLLSIFLSWSQSESLLNLILLMSLLSWMNPYRSLKGLILNTMTQDYYLAAKALGATPGHLFRKHIYPEVQQSLQTLFIIGVSSALIMEGGVSIMGLGVQAPQTSLGLLFYEGWSQMSIYPWLMLIPTTLYLIFILLLSKLKIKR